MSGNSISEKVAYPVIQALLTRVNSLRNNGNIEQAFAECETFISGLETLSNSGLPIANATGLANDVYRSPGPSIVSAIAAVSLSNVAVGISSEGKNSLKAKETVTAANLGAVTGNVLHTAGMGMVVAAAYLYALYQGESKESNNEYLQSVFYEQLLQTIKSTAVPAVTIAATAVITAIVSEAKTLLLALEIEKDGITSIDHDITKSNWPGPEQNRVNLAYTALKQYGNKNTAGILMYLHAKNNGFHAVEKMLPHTENTSRNSRVLEDEGWAIEAFAANYEEWNLVEKLLKTRDATTQISSKLFEDILGKAILKNDIKAIEMLFKYAPKTHELQRNSPNLTRKLIMRELARRQATPEFKHDKLPPEVFMNIESLLAYPSKIDNYFSDSAAIRTKVIEALQDKENPLHQKYTKEFAAIVKTIQREQKLDLAKLVFLKIIKAMDIPTPKDAKEQEHYKQVFRDNFKNQFYEIIQSKGISFIKGNEESIYAAAKSMKSKNLKIEDIDFSELLPKVPRTKLRG